MGCHGAPRFTNLGVGVDVTANRRHAEARPAGPPRVVDHIVEHLAAIGVEHIFGVGGANIEDLYDAAHFQPEVTAILAKLRQSIEDQQAA